MAKVVKDVKVEDGENMEHNIKVLFENVLGAWEGPFYYSTDLSCVMNSKHYRVMDVRSSGWLGNTQGTDKAIEIMDLTGQYTAEIFNERWLGDKVEKDGWEDKILFNNPSYNLIYTENEIDYKHIFFKERIEDKLFDGKLIFERFEADIDGNGKMMDIWSLYFPQYAEEGTDYKYQFTFTHIIKDTYELRCRRPEKGSLYNWNHIMAHIANNYMLPKAALANDGLNNVRVLSIEGDLV